MNTKKRKMDQFEEGGKKLKMESKSEPEVESQVQFQVENESFIIEELPPEMLMEVFKRLSTKSLFTCRLVNRRWNEIARELFKSRDDVEIVFDCCERKNRDFRAENLKLEICGKTSRATLENFMQMFDYSKETPLYTRFLFNRVDASVFDHPDWIKFISDFGKTIKGLRFVTDKDLKRRDESLTKFVEKLRDLLWTLNLEEFGLELVANDTSRWYNLNFFPRGGTPDEESRQVSIAPLKFPTLKVLYLNEYMFLTYPRISTDLLQAAVNLQRIEPFPVEKDVDNRKTVESILFLQPLGKLWCLQDVEIKLTAELLPKLEKMSKAPLDFKLRSLSLNMSKVYKDESIWQNTSFFISNLLESSKESLKELTFDAVGFLPDIQLPRFSKLTSFCIKKYDDEWYEDESISEDESAVDEFFPPVFPSGVKPVEIFPLLRSLEIVITPSFLNSIDSDSKIWSSSITELTVDFKDDVVDDVEDDVEDAYDAATVNLNKLFSSFEQTLQVWSIKGDLGDLLPDFQIPIMSQLTTLNLRSCESLPEIYPSTFPSLKVLDLGNNSIQMHRLFMSNNEIPCFSTVQELFIDGHYITSKDTDNLSRLCPNSKALYHYCSKGLYFDQAGPAIWTFFKKLQKLQIVVPGNYNGSDYPSMEAILAGLSKEQCLSLLQNPKFSSISETEAAVLRDGKPSIVDLQELEQLDIKVYADYCGYLEKCQNLIIFRNLCQKFMPKLKTYRFIFPGNKIISNLSF